MVESGKEATLRKTTMCMNWSLICVNLMPLKQSMEGMLVFPMRRALLRGRKLSFIVLYAVQFKANALQCYTDTPITLKPGKNM